MTERLKRLVAPRLFIRIFLWFWATTMALLATYSLTSGSFRPSWAVVGRELLAHAATRASNELRAGGPEALRACLDDIARDSNLTVYLLDDGAADPSGVRAPTEAQRLVRKLARTDSAASVRTLSGVWLGTSLPAPAGKWRFFVAFVSWRLFWTAPSSEETRWFPLVAIPLVTGIICLWLARRLALPATFLREATRALADGDLSARVTNPAVFRSGDELAELARDFNVMGERMEGLIANQRRIIGDISHELGSPLARLSLAVGLARKQLGPAAAPHLDRIEREAERLDELTQEVLDLVRTESAPRNRREPLRLDELVEDIVGDANVEAAALGRRVIIGASVRCVAEVDAELLRRAVENVIRNAVKYTAAGTTVQVEMASAGHGQVRIAVRDCGPGVPAESLPHLFEPFYRVEPGRDRKSGGAGLGLAIARQAIEKHGGAILAHNVPEGGLAVEIDLPVDAG
jgi:two-component system sensor histidine kinase CpxA